MRQHVEGSRTVVLAIPNESMRIQLRDSLTGMRWTVREARGGAEAMQLLEEQPSVDVLILHTSLPDLEIDAFSEVVRFSYPLLSIIRLEEGCKIESSQPVQHPELLNALRSVISKVPDACDSALPPRTESTRDPLGGASTL